MTTVDNFTFISKCSKLAQKSIRLDTTGSRRWSTENHANSVDLTIRTNDIFTNQNSPRKWDAKSPMRLWNFNFLHHSHWITLLTQSCLVFLCLFTALTYVIYRFVSFHTTCICYFDASIYSCLDIICLNGVVLLLQLKEVIFLSLGFSLLSHGQDSLRAISLVCRLKFPYICFSSHFCFLVMFVLLILELLVLFLVV